MHRIERLRLAIRGAVQGVGFRPFVYRLAVEIGLQGWVGNSAGGVTVEIEGDSAQHELFRRRLDAEKPANASIYSLEIVYLDPAGYSGFQIKESSGGPKTTSILPDIATCPSCLEEVFNPDNRRFRYPFTNCTNCGPRFSIILRLPYDRPNTTMRGFVMCDKCLAEYESPDDRRFHAQPNACPTCGPSVQARDRAGKLVASGESALQSVEQCLRAGEIAAVKGLGGFLLMLDARNQDAVARLRQFKNREEKPFALMYPSLDRLTEDVEVSEPERFLLHSPACPIVLLRSKKRSSIASNVAPGNPYLGAMLPYTPLHHLLLADLGFPLVATSGNLKDEPICTDEADAVERLGSLADVFLVHDRPIARPVDDSVARIIHGRESLLRRARGYAPLPVVVGRNLPTILAVGGHLKSTVALSVSDQVFVSQHLGDLETEEALDSFRATTRDLLSLYEAKPQVVACDLHPNYLSTQEAKSSGFEVFPVQHHYAHVLACMAEYGLEPPVLGISWDGTGFGPDGTIWGGEFLEIRERGYHRLAHLRPFPLPGGEAAVKEPRRSALGLLWAIYGEALFREPSFRSPAASSGAPGPLQAFSPRELKLLQTALSRQINSPITSSAGRLFDAVSSLAGIRQVTSFEGQAAMELEFVSSSSSSDRLYPFRLIPTEEEPGPSWWLDWEQTVTGILADLREGVTRADIGRAFHNTLCAMLAQTARKSSASKVVLSGGCFQNVLLTEGAIRSLRASGFQVYWHQRIPPNDGGLAVGQLMAAAREGIPALEK